MSTSTSCNVFIFLWLALNNVKISLRISGKLAWYLIAEKLKYLGILVTNDGKIDRQIDKWIGSVAAVLQLLYQLVMVHQELRLWTKLSVYQSIYIPFLTYGHKLW